MRGVFRRFGAVSGATALVLTMAACSSGDESSTSAQADLAGTSWLLSSYPSDQGEEVPAASGTDGAPLTFGSDGSFAGSTGCNRFSGTYTQDGDALTLTPGPMTLMACPGELEAQEAAVVAALPEVAAFTAGDSLMLMSGGGDTLLTYSAALTDLGGTSWQATGINNGKEAVVSTDATSNVTADFGADDTLSGSGGCNSYTASYTADAGRITIGPVAATKMACPDDAMQTEQQYFAALEQATTYTIEGTTLTLRDDSGAMMVSYRLVS